MTVSGTSGQSEGAHSSGPGPSWLPDAAVPIGEDDTFTLRPTVDRLARFIGDGEAPFTISLSGSWGIGKSTVAETLLTKLRDAGIPGVLIDAWSQDVDQLRRAVAVEVGSALRGASASREDIAAELDAAVHVSKTRTLPGTPRLALPKSIAEARERPVFMPTVAVLAWLLVAVIATYIWLPALTVAFSALLGAFMVYAVLQSGFVLSVETSTETQSPASESVEMAHRFEQAVTSDDPGAPRLVVVVIDNLDRLAPRDAMRALAEIRALVDIKGSRAVFLIPLDRDALASHVRAGLGGGPGDAAVSGTGADGHRTTGEGVEAARDYLEKFFGLDIALTKPEAVDLRPWALEQLRDLVGDQGEDDLRLAAQVISSFADGSPRTVKRMVNGVSARQKLTDPHAIPAPTLPQVALIQGVLTRFPELVSWIMADPRALARHQAAVTDSGDSTNEPPLPKARLVELRALLLANAEIELTSGHLRTMLALRGDRIWSGVEDPGPFEAALATGSAASFSGALDRLDAKEREAAVAGSIAHIDRSMPRFTRDAISGALAISGAVSGYADLARQLHPHIVQALTETDAGGRERMTVDLAAFVFDPEFDHPLVTRLADTYQEELRDVGDGQDMPAGVVIAVKHAAGLYSKFTLGQVRSRLGEVDDEGLEPLFDTPLEMSLLEGPVAQFYTDRLATWAPAADLAPHRVAVVRIVQLIEAGWDGEVRLPAVAAHFAGQIPRVNSAEDAEFITEVMRLLAALPNGAEVDQFAIAITQPPVAERFSTPERFAALLHLKTDGASRTAVETLVTTWFGTADEEEARTLTTEHRKALEVFDYDARSPLLARWVAGQGRQWAEIALDVDDEPSVDLLAETIDAAPGGRFVALLDDASAICECREDSEAAASVLRLIASRCATIDPSDLERASTAIATLVTSGSDPDAFVDALKERARTAEPGPLAQALHALDDAGVPRLRGAAQALAERGAAAGGVGLADVEWLVRGSAGSARSRDVLVSTIHGSALSELAEVARIGDGLSGTLRRSGAVGAALVRRASEPDVDDDNARLLLEAAQRWKRPTGGQLDAYHEQLTEIAKRAGGNLDELVNKLK